MSPASGGLNRLEYLGWTAAAQDLLGIRRSEAMMLRALVIDCPGSVVPYAALATRTAAEGQASPASRLVAKRLGYARRALVDIGFHLDCIETHLNHGYSVATHIARQINAAVVEGCPE